MNILPLSHTSLETIVSCLLEAFKDYFVPMPSDVAYWEARYHRARANFDLSWGVFDEETLTGFVVNAVDHVDGTLTAFNTGTGIVESHRGRQLVDRMYKAGIPQLKGKGIQQCTLEVIDQNHRAIRVYERIGFQVGPRLKSYKGPVVSDRKTTLVDRRLEDLPTIRHDVKYSWDFRTPTLLKAGDVYRAIEIIGDSDAPEGYVILNPKNGHIAQLETYTGNWGPIFDGIGQLAYEIRIVNIPADRTDLLSYLQHLGHRNTIDQYEMHMSL